ncbi:metallophosphoesterase [Pseudomonas putida]|uniref:Metallophosphoesterase n=1 Tax=Pseudomonas putida TaxID=303 RepID=A0A8I1JJL1_PSEPU|nr:metallophosphoesterase [Pseudomonas putida]MBI6882490.1 metallophosphoesterase [Pseudomonas putida]
MLDFIGDVHGHADHLEALLRKLGYRIKSGAYYHPGRKAVFLGDLIDRGPKQVETVNIARSMVDAGNALAILGNHEYNGVAWMTEDPDVPGGFLREHTESNRRQHRVFLDQVGEGSKLHMEMVDWFKSLPVYIDDTQFRAVHACWHAEHIKILDTYLDSNKVLPEGCWVPASREGTELYDAIENVLKGLEVSLPEGISYLDADGNPRTKTRTRWWLEDAKTYRDALLVPKAIQDRIPALPLPEYAKLRYDQDKVLAFGHYWFRGSPEVINEHMVCLDYSIGKGEPTSILCAYRWDGEKKLNSENLVYIGGDIQ